MGARADLGPPPHFGASRAQLGFGAWAVGGNSWGVPGTEAERLGAIHRAVERGVTFFDTAPTYGDGESERLLGRCLAHERERVRIATKVGPRDDPRQSLEMSLRRLGTDYVDLVQLHEATDQWERQMEVLTALREEGKARAVGLCNASHRQLARALALGPLSTYQAAYNMFDRDVEHRELPLCADRGVAFLAYRPLAAGLLSGKYETAPGFGAGDHRGRIYWFRGREFERRRAVIERIRALAERRGQAVATLALGWVLTRPGVAVVLAGARSAAQVDSHVAAVENPPDAATCAAIDAAVRDAFPLVRASEAARQAARDWGARERFIVEQLDGERDAEEIAAAWTDRGERPMIAAQVKVFVDELEARGLITRSSERGTAPS